MLPPAVKSYLDEHRTRHLRQLGELLRIASVANVRDGADGCGQAAEWLRRHLQTIGLDAEVVPTRGRPIVCAEPPGAGEGAPTVLIYAHYDVQPPDPLHAWCTPPFEPTVRDGKLFARGASDDKGQLLAQLMALEAWGRAGGGLPVTVKLLIEGEEEIGSPNLEAFVASRRGRFEADAVVISDSAFFAPDLPSLTYGLRGLAYFEIEMRGPSADVHSGEHGGAVANPVHALAALLAALHDASGRVTLAGFYDAVQPADEQERAAWGRLPFDAARYAASLGVDELGGGERGVGVLQRRWAHPALDANGIMGGYTAEGSKTIIPAKASAKVSARLVPRQDPERVVAAMRRFVAEHTPAGITASLAVQATARPVLVPRDGPAMTAARDALREAFGAEPALIRCGASVPAAEVLRRLLGAEVVAMGFGLPDDNIHSPNEKLNLEQLWRGSRAAAALLGNLARRG
jgi:acetylornithine deacetylase/succinyl-diaminopimelate desuccinylase-like protein